MEAISAKRLGKTYLVAVKDPGLAGTLRHFFRRRYKRIEAVKNVSFDIGEGEVVGFLGPNGAGKTTTLKMLTGLIYPSAGQVKVLGHVPFERRPEFLKKITLVMGNKQQLIWDLPVLDSLKINAAVYEIPDAEARRRIGAFAEMLGLEGVLKQPVRKLSLGQRMKAELMAALLHHPKLLFLDEPTLGLDVNAQVSVRAFLKAYRSQHRATILLTSHYMADIAALAERVLVIHHGELIFDGPLRLLVARFAPYREVSLEFDAQISRDALAAYGEVEALEGQKARLLVRREKLTETVRNLLAEFPVRDLTVSEPPVEDVIAKVFTAGRVA